MKIVLVGTPNAGKSTLFNRLLGRPLAIMDSQAGLTRDWLYAQGKFFDLELELYDTPGVYELEDIKGIIDQADLILFIINGEGGCTPWDKHMAIALNGYPVLLVVNKIDHKNTIDTLYDAHTLGFEEIVALSARTKEGLDDLYQHIKKIHTPTVGKINDMSLAIVGRPNTGKSTLTNALLGYQRSLVSSEPGYTRDLLYAQLEYKGNNICLLDTPGQRKNVRDRIEKTSQKKSLQSYQEADVVVLLLDATDPLTSYDMKIATDIINAGKPFILAFNKIDLAINSKEIQYLIEKKLSTMRGIQWLGISAIAKKNLDKLLHICLELFAKSQIKISTSALNRWLKEATEKHQPSMVNGRRPQLKYITQTNVKPPVFTIFVGGKTPPMDSYITYLLNNLRHSFELPTVPMQIKIRHNPNPYEGK